MLKRLLTLFAILTGLAAATAPVQARVALHEDIGVHLTRESATKCADRRVGVQALARQAFAERKGQVPVCSPAVVTIVIPAVMLQADRAHE